MARAWDARRESLEESLKEALAAPQIPRTVLFFAGEQLLAALASTRSLSLIF